MGLRINPIGKLCWIGKGQRRGRCIIEIENGVWKPFEEGRVWALEWDLQVGLQETQGKQVFRTSVFPVSICKDFGKCKNSRSTEK